MTGVSVFREYNVPKKDFLLFVDSLKDRCRVIAPVRHEKDGSQTVFEVLKPGEIPHMEYTDTAMPPGKKLFYAPEQEILKFKLLSGGDSPGTPFKDVSVDYMPPHQNGSFILLGIHPCDVHAIKYLEMTYNNDPYFRAIRDNTLIIALNCTTVTEFCFCSSVGTGPHLKLGGGFDAVLTDMGENYLVEIQTRKALELFDIKWPTAGQGEQDFKHHQENTLLSSFKRLIDIEAAEKFLLENIDHPVWARTADERCLSCTNCVMVCPTCFCHDIEDITGMDMKTVVRLRRWDACQDSGFSEVHGGNFRGTRAARLRQFVMHKLDYKAQYGTCGTVGCGRCIRWCPTAIDLTAIANEIVRNPLTVK